MGLVESRGIEHAAPPPAADEEGAIPEDEGDGQEPEIGLPDLRPDRTGIDVEAAHHEPEDGDGDAEGDERLRAQHPPPQRRLDVRRRGLGQAAARQGWTIGVFRGRQRRAAFRRRSRQSVSVSASRPVSPPSRDERRVPHPGGV